MATAVAPGQSGPPAAAGRHATTAAAPLYDLFLDLPHPAASKSSPPPFILGAPTTTPEMEKELSANLSRIGRFAFPEFDDATAARVPRDTQLNRFSQYAMQPKAFQHYTFSLQLQSGVRLHGHVRRYMPMHSVAKSRYDVGRRGERALVLMTRANGGDLVFSAILKTLDALAFQKASVKEKHQPHAEPQKWFLYKLVEKHQQLCAQFAALPMEERRAMELTMEGIEVGDKNIPLMNQVDVTRYLMPTSLLSPTSSAIEAVTSSSILPLLRVMGVQNTLRLLSALLSESRVLLLSSSPTRLAQCARSALSILAQGLLNWQHLYIPVLPPHLFQYLAAPVPYLIGMLTSLAPRLDQTKADGLGEMVILNLDTFQMETRGINPAEVAQRIPDLFRSAMAEQGLPAASMSATEMLAQDLVDLLKVDKRVLHGESALTNVSETAAKATKAVKSGLLKLKEKGKKFLKNRTSSTISDSGSDDELDPGGMEGTNGGMESNTLLPDFIYTQGAQNEVAEEEARIAFTSFFLAMFGNMRWYLSANPGKLPQLDRKRFLQQKRAMGEGENTPIWPLLQNFCQTQMLEEFAKARVEEVRTRAPVTADSALFTHCANYHRMHNIDFSVVSVRRVARQVAQSNPSRLILQTQARRTAMTLTSNRTFEGDYNKAVAQLVEQSRECSSVLFDIMSVIWVRLRDSKGLHWKHGVQALQILRNLLYHGPLAAVAEATDGLDKIRLMKFYNDNMRSQICTQIRQAAHQVYNLLVDRAKLYNIRRLCIHKRRVLRMADQGRFVKDSRMRATTPFKQIHAAFNPRSRAQVAPAPSMAERKPHFAAEQDLLGLTSFAAAPAAPPQQPTVSNPFDYAAPVPEAPKSSNTAQAIAGLMQGVSISGTAHAAPTSDPFAPRVQPAPTHAVTQAAAPVAVVPAPSAQTYTAQPAFGVGQTATPAQPYPSAQTQQAVQPYPPQLARGQAPGHPQYPPHQQAVPQQAQYPGPGHQQAATHTATATPYYSQGQAAPPPGYNTQVPQHAYPSQQQPTAYAQPPAAPPKPNVSQFDPFK